MQNSQSSILGRGKFFFSAVSSPYVGSIQPTIVGTTQTPIQWVLGAASLEQSGWWGGGVKLTTHLHLARYIHIHDAVLN
jgi:hypothetical protein